ncbi:MAG: hypothetical protein JWN48_3429 [Myxococcaceae bacterium]|nr:hypothetical protein [Myxococcaceae bacterium]
MLAAGCGGDDTAVAPGEGLGRNEDPAAAVDAGSGGGKDGGTKVSVPKKDAATTPKPPASASDSGNDTCASKTIPARSSPPDILIVQDRSLSMLAGRWGPSVAAVEDLTSRYENTVQFGLSLFPGPGGGCSVNTMPDQPLVINNAAPIKMTLDTSFPNGVTPTPQALKAALGFLGDHNQIGDTTVPPAYVVLVTDGEPDCPDGDFPNPVQGAVDATKALMDANIKTYAIGYQLDGAGKMLMDQVAAAGGTEHAFPVESPDDLNAAFAAITKDVVRCEFELDEVPADPAFVLVTIDGKTIKPDPADGWVIEGKKISLVGGSCNDLKDGSQHALNASVECDPPMYL